jgi:signal transduction histidine kinase
MHTFWRSAVQCLFGGVALAFVTLICFGLRLNLATAALLYLMVVVLLSLKGSFVSSGVVSLVAVGCLAYFFTVPIFSFRVDDPLNVVAIIAFLTTSLVITRLMTRVRKLADDQLSGMLINAQEAERSCLAAEIHDDFSQRLALLALGLETTAEKVPKASEDVSHQLKDLSNEVCNLGGDLHTLSHRLHSSTLESLGLVLSVNGFCKEFSAQQGIEIDFTHDQIPRKINPEVALCVFRIVQESLRNVKKHSGASKTQVTMQVVDGTIHLLVCDQGVGFNPKEIKRREGLGTRSMAERAHLLGGRLEIRSKLGTGTIIAVQVPLQPKSSSVA